MYLRALAAVAAVSTLSACTFNATLPKSDPALNAEAKALFTDLAQGRDDAVIARMSSENSPDAIRAQLPMLKTMIGKEPVPEPKVVAFQSVTSSQGRFYLVQQDYAYPDRVAQAKTSFIKEGDVWKVQGFNVNVQMTPAAAAAAAAAPAAAA